MGKLQSSFNNILDNFALMTVIVKNFVCKPCLPHKIGCSTLNTIVSGNSVKDRKFQKNAWALNKKEKLKKVRK